MSELLFMERIGKRFPGVQALDGVDFRARAGEVQALMGENGAGKSTLLKVLTGVYRPDSGRILLNGEPISPRSPLDAQAMGISAVYQEVNLIPHLSVAENVVLGRQPTRWGRIDWKAANRRAEAAMDRLDVSLDVTQPLSSYSIALQQMVAIARALDVSARLLILDEPTSSLDADEVDRLFGVLSRLKAEGLGIVFVTHFLDQVYRISDRITVLRNGRLVGEYEAAALPRIELVARMIGKDPAEVEAMEERSAQRAERPKATPFLQARGLGKTGSIEPLDLDAIPGETIGLAGLLGSGRTETARLLFGLDRADRGEILVEGERVVLSSPRKAIALRFGFLPEDRKTEGILPNLSIRENIVLALQARRGIFKRLSGAQQRRLADEYVRALNIATPDAEKPIGELSGGNQQKAILARWLASEPRFLILDEPTRGVDVGAKAEIERLIGKLREDGMAILFISSELEEIVRDSDRVAVMRDRRKAAELSGDAITAPAIMRAIAGAADV
jgi:simple sugar transport system ATP-binding protein